MVIIYLLRTFAFGIFLFFKRWYGEGFYNCYGITLRVLRFFERRIAVRVNIHFLLSPLYQEYNFFGYLFGFIFRSARIAAGGALYALVSVVAIIIFMLWALVPIALVYKIFT